MTDSKMLFSEREREEEGPLEAWLQDEDDLVVYLYRIDSEREFLARLVPPVTLEQIQQRFGGGRYELVAYAPQGDHSGRVRIVGRRKVVIGGIPSTSAPSVPSSLSSGGVKEFLEIYNSLKGDDSVRTQVELMGKVQASLTSMLIQQMQLMQSWMTMAETLREKAQGGGTSEILLTAIDKIGSVLTAYLQAKNGDQHDGRPELEDRKMIQKLVDRLNRLTEIEGEIPTEEIDHISDALSERGLLAEAEEIGFDNLVKMLSAWGLKTDGNRMERLREIFDRVFS